MAESATAAMARFPEMNPGPVLRMDRTGRIILANTVARALFGRDSLDGANWTQLCPGLRAADWERVLAHEPNVLHEAEFGDRCMLFAHVHPPDESSVFVFGTDITERRRAERQLAEQAAKVAEVARFPDMNPGPVLRMDIERCVLLANAAAKAVFGAELVGRDWGTICPGIDGGVWQRILDATVPVPHEARIGERDFVFAHRRDHQGSLVFVYGADVTQQRRTERALRQSEKMATLGTLAAGVAHELNNPAAATRRAADQMRMSFGALKRAQMELAAHVLPDEARTLLDGLDRRAAEYASTPSQLDPLARADREASVEEWLEEFGIDEAWQLAAPLAAARVDRTQLDSIVRAVGAGALAPALASVAHAYQVYALLCEIGSGSARISEIVGALKNYSYLGQAPAQFINVHDGIDSTLVMLRSKLKSDIAVEREYAADLPRVPAYGSELNQVWTNLLDNAIDALGGSGRIVIRTSRDADCAVVEIEDNGLGIPPEIQSRVFDPFFTTKAPGKGTGLGLSTSYSIITEKHRGQMSVESCPGCTCFSVRLPLASAKE